MCDERECDWGTPQSIFFFVYFHRTGATRKNGFTFPKTFQTNAKPEESIESNKSIAATHVFLPYLHVTQNRTETIQR